jgi:serine/threonine-protein kinase
MVCIKSLHRRTTKASLLQECKSLARLDHPNIVRLIDFDVDCAVPFLVTEYVEGPNLHRYLKSNPRPSLEFTLAVARSLLAAAQYGHQREIIHRDLKPANILMAALTGESAAETVMTPKIVDFGLALIDQYDADDCLTAEGNPMGTPVYMAPEQFEGRRLTSKCDIYAIGVILWEMVAGIRPFSTSRLAEIGCLKCMQPLKLEGDERARIPELLSRLIEQCTAPVPEHRPSACQALASIELIQGEVGSAASMVNRHRPAWLKLLHHWWLPNRSRN